MRRVAAAGGEVHEERLVRVLGAHPVQPFDCGVGHRVREVMRVLVVVEIVGGPDHLLVLGQTGIPLRGAACQEAVEIVEPPAVRPPVERSRRPLLPVGREVPLSVRGGAVAVVAQDPRKRRTVAGKSGRIAREPPRELTDGTEADEVVVPPGQQRGPCRGAQRRDVEPVVAQTRLGHARVVRRVDRPTERARVPEAGIVDQDEQDIRRAVRRHRMAQQFPIGLRPGERLVDDPAERRASDRQPRAVDRVGHCVHPRWSRRRRRSGSIQRGARAGSITPNG